MQQRAERRRVRRLLAHLDLAIADGDGVDAEGRAGMGEAGARDQLVGRGEIADGRMVGEQRLAAGADRHAGPGPHRHHDVGLQLIGEVQHPQPTGAADRLATAGLDPQRVEASAFFVALRQECEHAAQ